MANGIYDRIDLLDLPRELHLKIADECLFHTVRVPKHEANPLGRHGRRNLDNRFLRCGSLRDLTLVNMYFRELTVSYLWENICLDDLATATHEDKLQNTHAELTRLSHRFEHMKKLTISIGRTPNPPGPYAAADFIELLRELQDIETMRFVMESDAATYSILSNVKNLLVQYLRGDIDHRALNLFTTSSSWSFRVLGASTIGTSPT